MELFLQEIKKKLSPVLFIHVFVNFVFYVREIIVMHEVKLFASTTLNKKKSNNIEKKILKIVD